MFARSNSDLGSVGKITLRTIDNADNILRNDIIIGTFPLISGRGYTTTLPSYQMTIVYETMVLRDFSVPSSGVYSSLLLSTWGPK